jgi:hypothetical protein
MGLVAVDSADQKVFAGLGKIETVSSSSCGKTVRGSAATGIPELIPSPPNGSPLSEAIWRQSSYLLAISLSFGRAQWN